MLTSSCHSCRMIHHECELRAVIALGRLGDVSIADKIIPLATQAGEERPDPAKANAVTGHSTLSAASTARTECRRSLPGGTRRIKPQGRAASVAFDAQPVQAVDGLIERLGTDSATWTNATSLLVTLDPALPARDSLRRIVVGHPPGYDRPVLRSNDLGAERSASLLFLTTAIKAAKPKRLTARLSAELVRHQVDSCGA